MLAPLIFPRKISNLVLAGLSLILQVHPWGSRIVVTKSQRRKNHLISFLLVTSLELLAFVQLLVPLLLSSVCACVIFLRRLFKRCLDVLIRLPLNADQSRNQMTMPINSSISCFSS